MIVTSSRKRLFLSLGHFFEIFSCEGLIQSLDALYPAAITQKTKNMIFLSSFHGDFRPEAIKRRRKWISFVNFTIKNLSASIEKKNAMVTRRFIRDKRGALETWTGQR